MQEANDVTTPMISSLKLSKEGSGGVKSERVDVPYRQVIGSLLYASLATRSDITFSVGLLSRFCESPRLVHWVALKRILRYCRTTASMGIQVTRNQNLDIQAYSDADLAGCADSRKSTSGTAIFLNGGPVKWRSTKQTIVATSTCEAEFVAAAPATRDIIWLKGFLNELHFSFDAIPLHVDNLGTVKLINNNQSYASTKHLDIKLHFVRDYQEKKLISVKSIASESNLADTLTKPLPDPRFSKMLSKWSLVVLSVMAMICVQSSAFILSEEYEITPHRYALVYESSCGLITNPQLKDEVNRAMDWNAKQKNPVVVNNFPHTELYFQYNKCVVHVNKLYSIIKQLPASLKRLMKRGIADEFFKRAIIATGVIKSLATNFISGDAKRVVEQSVIHGAKKLLESVVKRAQDSYNNRSIVPVDIEKQEIVSVSRFAGSHQDLVMDVIKGHDYEDRFLDYNDDEISAAYVLLRSIEIGLRQGYLDTRALGELVEDEKIIEIDPQSTHVTRMVHDSNMNLLEFHFDVLRRRDISERLVWIDIVAVACSIAVSTSLGVGGLVLRKRNRRVV